VTIIPPDPHFSAALQAQLGALRERARAHARPAAAAPASNTPATLLQRISSISSDDPDRRRKAVRVYLEGELSREFGDGLLNDPAFPQMLDAVQQQMQEDAQTAKAVDALGDLLLAGRTG
jgi:hypothetical protein